MSASFMSILGGQPSITTPMPPPCDSPKVVMRKSWPNELPILGNVKRHRGRSLPFSDRRERLAQIVDQIAHVFHADRPPNERIADAELLAFFWRNGAVGHE